jgi:hypothetical protein
MALLPESGHAGIAGVIGAMVVLFTGINVQRSPFQSLVADLVPSRHRSLASGSVTVQICVGAIVFLMLGQLLGMQAAYRIAALTVLVIAAAVAFGLREPRASHTSVVESTVPSLVGAARSAVRGDIPGLRAIFLASLLLQLTFQSFTTWYALYGSERFGVRPRRRHDRIHRGGRRRRHRRAARGNHRRPGRPACDDARRVRADGRLPGRTGPGDDGRPGHAADRAGVRPRPGRCR